MILTTNKINIAAKKLISDIGGRNGLATSDSLTTLDGCLDTVRSYLGITYKGDIPVEALLEQCDDFDADKKKPYLFTPEEEYDASLAETVEVPTFNPSTDPTDFKGYARRIEDIRPEDLIKYIENLCVTLKVKSGALSRHNKENQLQRALMFDGDNGLEIVENADMVSDAHERVSQREQAIARDRISYVVKRLHNLSRLSGVHVLSAVQAYYKARQKWYNETVARTTTRALHQNAIWDMGIWLADKEGNRSRTVPHTTKNPKIIAILAFLLREDNNFKSYRSDVDDLLTYVDVLNIDMVDDDWSEYDSEFFKRLIVTTATPNKQYDREVDLALRTNATNMDVYKDNEVLTRLVDMFRMALTTTDVGKQIESGATSIQLQSNFTSTMRFVNKYYSIYYQRFVYSTDVSWINGLLAIDGQVVYFLRTAVDQPKNPKDRIGTGVLCVVHELGYVLQVADELQLYLMHVNEAEDNLNALADRTEQPNTWRVVIP